MTEPTLATTELPPPRGYQFTVPDSASFPLRDLDTTGRNLVARMLRRAVVTLRARPAAPISGCLNRSTCRPGIHTGTGTPTPCCLLCAMDLAVVRLARDTGAQDPNANSAASLLLHGSIAKQLALDTIDANPHHGGEIAVLNHLADNIHTLTDGTPQ